MNIFVVIIWIYSSFAVTAAVAVSVMTVPYLNRPEDDLVFMRRLFVPCICLMYLNCSFLSSLHSFVLLYIEMSSAWCHHNKLKQQWGAAADRGGVRMTSVCFWNTTYAVIQVYAQKHNRIITAFHSSIIYHYYCLSLVKHNSNRPLKMNSSCCSRIPILWSTFGKHIISINMSNYFLEIALCY